MSTTLDVESLVASQMTGRTSGCRTCWWLTTRTADERAKWLVVMSDTGRWPHAAVFRAISLADPDGPTPGLSSVENHRHARHKVSP